MTATCEPGTGRGAFTGTLPAASPHLRGSWAAAPAAPVLLATGYLVTPGIPAPALWVGAERVALAGLVLLALWPALPRGHWWWRALVGGVATLGGTFVLQAFATQRLGAALAAAIVAGTVLINTALAVKRRLEHPATVLLTLAAVAGLAVALDVAPHPATRLDVLGVLAAIGAALCLALGKEVTRRWGTPAGVSPVTVTGWQLCGGAVVLAPLAFAVSGPPPGLALGQALLLGWLAIPATAVAYGVQLGGLAHGVPAAAVSRLAMMTPVLTTAAGWWLDGRSPGVAEAVALAVTVGAIAGGVAYAAFGVAMLRGAR